MRKEVKIGVVVGLVLAAVVIVYMVFAVNRENPLPVDNFADQVQPDTDINKVDLTFLPITVDTATSMPASAPVNFPDPAFGVTSEPIAATQPGAARLDIGNNATNPADSSAYSTVTRQEEKSYTVKTGDSLWKIAQEVYGDGSKYQLIEKANQGVNSNSLRVGQKLVIPSLTDRPAASVSDSREGTSDGLVTGGDRTTQGTVYIVKEGDAGLWAIAKKHYGDGSKYKLIEKANPGIRGGIIRAGQKLILPLESGSPSVTPSPAAQPVPAAPARTVRAQEEPSDRPIMD